jgi:hypothetical protein
MSETAPNPVIDPAVLHAETADARQAYEAQLETNAKFAAEALQLPTAAEQVEDDIRRQRYDQVVQNGLAHPERLSGNGVSGWDELQRAAAAAGDQAALAHRERRGRERSFAEGLATDSWDTTVHTLDGARARAEATGNWTEFDTYFDQLRTKERDAYTQYVDGSRAPAPEPEPTPTTPSPSTPPAPAPAAAAKEVVLPAAGTEAEPTSPPPPENPTLPATPTEATADTGDQGPAREPDQTQEIPVVDPDATQPLAPVPPMPGMPPIARELMRSDGGDPRLKGHQTWTSGDVEVARAREAGEHVPEAPRLLGPEHFKGMEDLPQQGVDLVRQLALHNLQVERGQQVHKGVKEKMDKLMAELDEKFNGLGRKLFDLYAAGGKFNDESTRITEKDAELIDWVYQLKGSKRNNNRLRKKIQRRWIELNDAERGVPVNWNVNPDGTYTAVALPRRPKGDWLMDRHSGDLLKKELGTFQKREGKIRTGEMMEPVGAADRTKRRLGRGALALVTAPTKAPALVRGARRATVATGRTLNPAGLFERSIDTSATSPLYAGRGPGDWVIPPRAAAPERTRRPLRERLAAGVGRIAAVPGVVRRQLMTTPPAPEVRPPGAQVVGGEGLPTRPLETLEDVEAYERAQREARS